MRILYSKTSQGKILILLKHIHNAEWYKSAYHNYNDKYGYDKKRVICGVIFACDKTHTDEKD